MEVDEVLAAPVLDCDGAIARLGGDRDLFIDMLGFFFEDAPELLADLKRAVRLGDSAKVRMSAHALRGLVAGCGGDRAAAAAKRVEDAAHADDFDVLPPLVDSLDGELNRLVDTAREFQARESR